MISSSVADIRKRCDELLAELAGPSAVLRDDQFEAIRALVQDRRRVLVVQRTGWGKSAVYFLAAKLLREQGAGPTIVVSPLLALMRDQLLAASRVGLVAETINSANVDDWLVVEKLLADDQVDLLAISPERLNNPKFVESVLPQLAARVGLVVIDEAHCISQWGHDFRPDYLRIRDALQRLTPGTPVLATTATATNWVVDDVAQQLGTEPVTLRGTLDRSSLRLSVVTLPTTADRLAWLVEQLPAMSGSGIVYCLTQAAAEQTAAWLSSQGIAAAAYTGATETTERERLEDALRNNELKVLAATSALGMGFDKPDLGFAINLGSPSSITAYYQMVGRAGRAIEHAEGVLLPSEDDQRVWNWFDSVSFPPRQLAERVVSALHTDQPQSEAKIESVVDIKRTRLTSLLKVLDVEGAVARQPGGWVRTANSWQYNQERYDRVRTARQVDQQQMLDYQATPQCRMVFLRQALDDPELTDGWACDRCDVCLDSRVVAPSATLVAQANAHCRDVDIILRSRKMWPSGMNGRKGKIPLDLQALDGRALSELGTPGWADLVSQALQDWQTVGAEPPAIAQEIIDALAGLLKRWGWPDGRAVAITWVPSADTGHCLAQSVAQALGNVGKLPVQELLRRTRDAPSQAEMGNSAHACANVLDAFEITDPALMPHGPVLVVDDTWASGWTTTVLAELLRAAGAGPIYPLVLQRT